jgi:hypothetical protein
VWVIGAAGLMRVDTERNTPGHVVAFAGEPRGVVVDGDSAWTRTRGGQLRVIDTRSGHVTRELRVQAPPGAALGGEPGALLVRCGDDRLARVDERSGRMRWSVRLGGELDVTGPGSGDTIWAHRSDGVLMRLDAGTGRTTGALRLPPDRGAGIAESGSDQVLVATASGSLAVATR